MAISSQSPREAIDVDHIDHWITTATNKRLELLIRAAEPLYLARANAFTEMAELLKDAIEELRVLSATLRQESQELRTHASGLKEKSKELQARSKRGRPHRHRLLGDLTALDSH